MKKIFTKKNIIDFIIINIGVFLMAFAYAVFIDPYNLIIGGVGGIATVCKNIFSNLGYSISSSLFILVLNIILLIFALFFVSKEFFAKTILVSLIYPLYTFFCELIYKFCIKNNFIDINAINQIANNNEIVKNMILIGPYFLLVIFGATISSIGLGLALKKGSSTGGVDILQKILLKHFKIPYSVSLIFIDGSIVLGASIYFRSYFILLYGIIFIIISGLLVDSIVFNGFNSRAVNIITSKPEEIKKQVIEHFDRTVTEVTGIGGYSGNEKKILICIMANSEFYHLKDIVNKIDPKAFIYVTKASEVHGEGFTYEAPQNKE